VKRFGANTVLREFQWGGQIRNGHAAGPSGCGKSTLLRAVAGLNDVDGGQVFSNGQDVNQVDVRKRRVGMVFQSYALFPNMTAAQNVAFGLSIEKRQGGNRIAVRNDRAGVGFPARKSAPQPAFRRPAAARGARPRADHETKVLLLDETLSALDAQIRQSLREQIREIQQKMQMTAIFVTHDQEEAMSISDRVFVMHDGVIAQQARPIRST
jgi:putative spermidine/putrescine transport system ATP-binding protein